MAGHAACPYRSTHDCRRLTQPCLLHPDTRCALSPIDRPSTRSTPCAITCAQSARQQVRTCAPERCPVATSPRDRCLSTPSLNRICSCRSNLRLTLILEITLYILSIVTSSNRPPFLSVSASQIEAQCTGSASISAIVQSLAVLFPSQASASSHICDCSSHAKNARDSRVIHTRLTRAWTPW